MVERPAGMAVPHNFPKGAIWHRNQNIPISFGKLGDERRDYRNGSRVPDIVTLTINPAIDIFVNVGRVEPTRKLRFGAET